MLLQCPETVESLLNDAKTTLAAFFSTLLEASIDQILH